MPGIFRPYTLVDVLGTINDQSTQTTANDIIDGLSDFAEVDETFPITDSATGTVQANPAWDSGTWGTFTWS